MTSLQQFIIISYSPFNFFRLWGAVAFICIMLHIAERALPAEQDQSYRSMIINSRITLIYAILSPAALFGANYFIGYLAAAMINYFPGLARASYFGALAGNSSMPVKAATLALLVILPLLAYDFFYYWFHRLQRANSWLWEQHKLHHSDHALNVTTSYRINWLEDFFKTFLVSAPMAMALLHFTYPSGIRQGRADR